MLGHANLNIRARFGGTVNHLIPSRSSVSLFKSQASKNITRLTNMIASRPSITTTIAAALLAIHAVEAGTASDDASPSQTTCNIPFGSMMVTAYHALGQHLMCRDCVRVTNKNGGKIAGVKFIDLDGAPGTCHAVSV
ncbi:TPA: LOW QUALITY PROTEIN: hypothetical protein N0F65_001059 [Lagenidium giganteum]|uniref:Uncharacterized protein n=1 Tax=Lagenidium giganteum TaxID=4803 RepID=A0AAV2YMN5_9STRA|nr:TPA: LOW QUALITY PROTEIN: hypothetical protein N0F65_001059 [Lagenidium giganteum]